jgi:hypothetical protein
MVKSDAGLSASDAPGKPVPLFPLGAAGWLWFNNARFFGAAEHNPFL